MTVDKGTYEEAEFACPALRDRFKDPNDEALTLPAPVELSWDICSNGGVSVLFAVLLVVSFFFAVRLHNGEKLYTILQNPMAKFMPPSLLFFAAFIGTLSFVLTFPMFVTRFNTGRWIGKFVMQQLIPDAFAKMVGCQPLQDGNTTYLLYPLGGEPQPQQQDQLELGQVAEFDYNKWTDWAFLPHASFGILWDFFGTLHICLATYSWTHQGSTSFHKRLGQFSIGIFTCHMLGAAHLLYRDVAHHNSFPRFSLFADVIQSTAYMIRGVLAIKNKNKPQNRQHMIHKVLMFFAFVHAIEGSGQIRFTAWWIWLISRFVPMRYAVYFDTTVCQGSNYAICPRASAGNCVLAYMIRMNFLRMTTIYWKLCFFRIPYFSKLTETKAYVWTELQNQFKALLIFVVGVLWVEFRADKYVPRLFPFLREFLDDNVFSLVFFGIPVLLRLNTDGKYIGLLLVIALIWNSSPFTPTFLNAAWVWFIIGSFLFGFTTKIYVDEVIESIDKVKLD